jgi:hypothetical protein
MTFEVLGANDGDCGAGSHDWDTEWLMRYKLFLWFHLYLLHRGEDDKIWVPTILVLWLFS